MADSIITAAPLNSYSELRNKWFCEIPIEGILAGSGELIGARSLDHLSTPLETNSTLSVILERGFNCSCPVFLSTGILLGNKFPDFEGVFESKGTILGSIGLDFFFPPLESSSELLGEFIRDIIISGELESKGQLICSQLAFVTGNYNYFILSDGALLTVSGDIGCFEISAYPIIESLETNDELIADQSIIGGVNITWGELESSDSLNARFILEVIEQDELISTDSIFALFHASRGVRWVTFPLETISEIRSSWSVVNLPAGEMFHETDIISLTKPLDIIKLSPGRTLCL